MKTAALLLLCLSLVSCAGSSWSERAAKDRIMLVREDPATLGYHRLQSQTADYPDLREFVAKKGRPDFIAETTSDDRGYLILYYLESETAYACRGWRGRGVIEFAGPYPITEQETDVLSKLKAGATPESSSGIASGRILVP